MPKKTITITQTVEVEYDATKLSDPEFNEEFNRYIFKTDGIDDHLKHLAACEARGLIGFDNFVEGYGDITKFGVKIDVKDCDAEIEDQ